MRKEISMNNDKDFYKNMSRIRRKLFTHIILIGWYIYFVYQYRHLFWKVCLILLIFSALFKLPILFTKKPLLQLRREGIVERLTLLYARDIPWREVEQVEYQSVIWGDIIILYLKDFENFVRSQSLLSRLSIRFRQIFFGKKGMILDPLFLEENPTVIVEEIRQYQDFISQ